MEKTTQKAVERVTVTELRLTAEDVIAALRRGNGKLFKDAEVTVGMTLKESANMDPVAMGDGDVLIVTITQTTRREAK